ncbi:MAG: FHA domain-containing protein, partial [Sandaracinaceae bacterium]|nr:FHA domain-containing protein [Sandaracinaceae bacterium]
MSFNLLISDDEGRTTVVPLTNIREEITIGRKEGNTIRLTERNVSRYHAKLRHVDGRYVIVDLNSYNGVFVNGRRISGEQVLQPGDRITIGDYQLTLEAPSREAIGSGASAVPQAFTPPPSQTLPPRLVMLTPPRPGAEYPLISNRIRIGRGEVELRIDYPSVSREHAEVVRDGDSFRLRDLQSANGVRVSGR